MIGITSFVNYRVVVALLALVVAGSFTVHGALSQAPASGVRGTFDADRASSGAQRYIPYG